MQTENKKTESKLTPKLSALAMALVTAFFVVACGGGGSAVGSDGADSVKTGASTGTSGSTGTTSASGAVKDDDDDDCKTTTTTVAAKSKNEIEDDDANELEDDDEKCATTPPAPPTAAELAAGKLGKALWATNCFSCHGADTHEVRTAARILKAINENKGGMGKLKGVISETDAANIAVYAARPSAF